MPKSISFSLITSLSTATLLLILSVTGASSKNGETLQERAKLLDQKKFKQYEITTSYLTLNNLCSEIGKHELSTAQKHLLESGITSITVNEIVEYIQSPEMKDFTKSLTADVEKNHQVQITQESLSGMSCFILKLHPFNKVEN